MLYNYRMWLARRRIVRRNRRRGVLEFLGTWLPIWCGLTVLFCALLRPLGCMLLMLIPAWVIGRYFVARRRGDIVIQKIYGIIRLNHPLSENLLLAANCDRGTVGVRLRALSELLQQGLPLAEALRLALPELPAADCVSIDEADRSGRLRQELERLNARRNGWPVTSELDASYGLYILATLCVLLFAIAGICTFVEPKYRSMLREYGFSFGNHWFTRVIIAEPSQLWTQILAIAIAAAIVAAGAALRRLVMPFFRTGTVTIYIRDRVAWWLPILGPMIRWRSWSDGTRILAQGIAAGQLLPEVSQSAAMAVCSRVARRRFRQWRERMLAGMSADSAARRSGLPRIVFRALAQPLGSTGSALALVAGYYDLKYRRRVEIIRAVSIPLAVLCMGTLVLMVCLALYVPYVELLQVIGGGGG